MLYECEIVHHSGCSNINTDPNKLPTYLCNLYAVLFNIDILFNRNKSLSLKHCRGTYRSGYIPYRCGYIPYRCWYIPYRGGNVPYSYKYSPYRSGYIPYNHYLPFQSRAGIIWRGRVVGFENQICFVRGWRPFLIHIYKHLKYLPPPFPKYLDPPLSVYELPRLWPNHKTKSYRC